MSDDNSSSTEAQNLNEQPYGDLMNASRSAREQFEEVEIDTDAPKKDELIESMNEYAFEGSRDEGWTIEINGDRKEIDLLKVQTNEGSNGSQSSSGPKDKTILYCLTRKETTGARVEEIRHALEEQGKYELRESGSGDKFSIILPAENDPDQMHHFEEGSEDEEVEQPEPEETARREVGIESSDDLLAGLADDVASEEGAEKAFLVETHEDSGKDETMIAEFGLVGVEKSDESEEEDSEEEEEVEEEDSQEEDEESPESESEDSDEQEEDEVEEDEEEEENDEDQDEEDDDLLNREAVRSNWEDNKTKGDLYTMAQDEDIEGRSEMSKEELIDALLDAKDKIADE